MAQLVEFVATTHKSTTLVPSTQEEGMEWYEIKVVLGYVLNLRLAWAIMRPYFKTNKLHKEVPYTLIHNAVTRFVIDTLCHIPFIPFYVKTHL